ncbi:AlkA N-terminal domain-containing protein [Aeromicrobium sp. Leaf350]|uniref:AlkA N-terminal domain-containing protein n=1 Tax=Aeromicrobium sp. Leaf350 TaxID=2876565 RepID=UPI001E30FC38|nr:AlkA N-terminal domain-containing protein [Aeromicrobium sp. Leaf350]
MTTTDPLHERRYRAVRSRDARFDGVFFTAVRTTGIYCRPSCPAVTPRSENVVFYRSSAAAHGAGFRACRRCRPDTVPGSPEWDHRADAVGRAVRLVRDGVVERDGVEGLAARLGYSSRQVHRMLTAELGVGPLALARGARAHTARILVETTTLSMADVAHAAGFASVRQFNDTMREVYDATPSQLRSKRGPGTAGGHLTLRLAVRRPFDGVGLLQFLDDHAVPGLESVRDGTYARLVRLPHGVGVVELTPADGHVVARLELADLRDTAVAVERARRLLDLDADPVAIDEVLGADPVLAESVREAPGLRLPGGFDAVEVAVRTVVGQQVSVAGARTVLGRLVAQEGEPVELALAAEHGLTHLFPSVGVLAGLDPETLPMPRSRGRAVATVAGAVVSGDLDLTPGADRAATRAALLALPGIGPWTADYVMMRGLGDPDVLLTSDLVLRRELERHHVTAADAARWAPWRSYAGMHLWRAATRPGRI